MTTDRKSGTFPLDELDDYRIAESETDPRGWDVTSADNQRVGTVKDMFVDLEQMKVRYLVVKLDVEQSNATDRCVLIPIGAARLVDDEDRVIVSRTASAMRALPGYTLGGRLEREHEELVLSAWPRRGDAALATFYDREEFDSEKFYGSRYTGDSGAEPRQRTGSAVDERVDRVVRDTDGAAHAPRWISPEDRPMV